MPTYVSLLQWTQRGIENVKDSPARLEAAKEEFQSMGVEMKDFYLLMGQYDLLVVVEAPDAASVTKAVLHQASLGAIRTETFRAYTEDEYREIVAGIP